LLPDGTWDGYRLAEIECSAGCLPEEVQLWHLIKLGELPPQEPDQQVRRYAAGALRRILGELPDRPSERQLRRAAFDAGRWLAAGSLPPDPVADALLAAAGRAGFDPATITPDLAAALTAGRARRSGRLPR
jgi:hypothetical protein